MPQNKKLSATQLWDLLFALLWLLQVVPIYVEHWGNNFQFCAIFNIWGDEARPLFFHVGKSSEDQTIKNLHREN